MQLCRGRGARCWLPVWLLALPSAWLAFAQRVVSTSMLLLFKVCALPAQGPRSQLTGSLVLAESGLQGVLWLWLLGGGGRMLSAHAEHALRELTCPSPSITACAPRTAPTTSTQAASAASSTSGNGSAAPWQRTELPKTFEAATAEPRIYKWCALPADHRATALPVATLG